MVDNHHQPRALPFLFLTEMWERFGFYTVQGLLVLYLTKALGYPDDVSGFIVGMYTAFTYMATLLGGVLADRVLGYKAAVIVGTCLFIVGYSLLALPMQNFLFIALSIAAVGNGFFKPNISSLLGTLYEKNSTDRDAGFTLFYMGINLGVFLAGMTSGYIQLKFGWHHSFALAVVGMLVALMVFCCSFRFLKKVKLPQPKTIFLSKPMMIVYCLVTVLVMSLLFSYRTLSSILLPAFAIVVLTYLLVHTIRQPSQQYRAGLLTLTILIITSSIFWAIFWQMFLAANNYIDRLVDHHWLGLNLTTTMFYALEALYIFILGPIFAWIWSALQIAKRDPSPVVKFIVALLILGAGFVVLGFSTDFMDPLTLKVSPLWIVFSYFLITCGEMLLSPIGLSAVTLYSPPQLTGMLMGIWFVATGFGGALGGLLNKIASVPKALQVPTQELPYYQHAFLTYAGIAVIAALVLFIVWGLVRKHVKV